MHPLPHPAQVSRDDFLEPHFNCTFDALFRLVADPDPAVHQATTFLDALMKARSFALNRLKATINRMSMHLHALAAYYPCVQSCSGLVSKPGISQRVTCAAS